MAGYNKVILLGNLTRDPEVRMTPKGTAVCQFGLAVNRTFKDEGGNQREEVTFIDIEAWGRQADVLAKYCQKGRPLFVEGRLRLDSWEDKNTKEKRSKMKVVLENFQFVGGGDRGERGGDGGGGGGEHDERPRSAPPPSRGAPAPRPAQDLDEDVPF